MPYLITKKSRIADLNRFYENCIKDGSVYVVCCTRTKYADVEFDAHTLGDKVREYFSKDARDLELVAKNVFEDFGLPQTTQRTRDYIISFNGLPIDIARWFHKKILFNIKWLCVICWYAVVFFNFGLFLAIEIIKQSGVMFFNLI
ncbi:MAG: hypothetical protein QM498_06360 [Desulfobacterium sp.]